MDYDKLFWGGVITYILATSVYMAALSGSLGAIYYVSVLGAVAMFVGSKIGRTFLGLA
jgi:hypothetical protein